MTRRPGLRAMSAIAALLLLSCLRPAQERVKLDRKVGRAEIAGTVVRETDGLASIQQLGDGAVSLWAAAPVLSLTVDPATDATRMWTVRVHNAMPDAVLTGVSGGTPLGVTELPEELPTRRSFRVELVPGQRADLTVAPADATVAEPYRFAVMSDVQNAIGTVDEVFAAIDEDPSIRFVISTGDLVNRGDRSELVRFQEELQALGIPFFSTYGNHEAAGDPLDWHELFGPFNARFIFKGVFFSLIDSGDGTIDPAVYDALGPWLDTAREDVHIFATHIPFLDPSGVRSVAFRSRPEALKIINLLAEHDVDAVFFGHLHSYYSFSLGNVPAYISGGGGAYPERFDGIGRHFLTVDVTPGEGIDRVAAIRVD